MIQRSIRRAAALAVLPALVWAVPAAGAPVTFDDRTSAAGLDYTPSLMADMAGGAMFSGGSVGDFNRDGWPDLFMLGGGNVVDALFINNGDGTFTDKAADWGVDLLHRGRGTTVGDFNADGWPDLYVTSSGDLTGGERIGQHMLYRNNGDGTFTDIAGSAGVNLTSPTSTIATGAAFGDYDLDGDLDLFVCHYDGNDGSRLFRNNGDETFADVTGTAGIDQDFFGFSPRFVDMNGDRYPELLIANDYVTSRYYVNNGDGTFTDETASSGTGLEDNGMGTTVADFNRDGRPDWYVTSIYEDMTHKDGNYLYVNQGSDTYTVLREADGARNAGWSWGSEALDLDHDGFIDIAATNGWGTPEFTLEETYLYRNNGDMTFSEVQGGTSGFDHVAQGRTLLTLDYDRDGDMDIALTAFEGAIALYRNDVSGADANWLEVALDTSGDPGLAPDGYGAKVTAVSGGVTQYFWINGGATYLGRSQPVAHFGLGSSTTVDTLTVDWPDGTSKVWTNLAANQMPTMSPTIAGAPGEAVQMRARYNKTTGQIEVRYGASCGSSDHTIYYGDLANVASYTYSGAACFLGRTGHASFDPGLDNAFFLIVGNTGAVEGSYGPDSVGVERPEDVGTAVCDLSQDLSGTCDLP
jgi:hypothetical protein